MDRTESETHYSTFSTVEMLEVLATRTAILALSRSRPVNLARSHDCLLRLSEEARRRGWPFLPYLGTPAD